MNIHRRTLISVVFALSLAAPAGAAATTSTVECGQVVAYTAPDPATPADGSLTLGELPAWVIAAAATVSGPVAAVLPAFAGSGPSCLAFDLDDSGVITALDFASQGTLTGSVVPDAGIGGLIFDDRIFIPTFILDAYPGLAAVFTTSAAAHSPVTATFFVDTATGQFTGFDVQAAFCGAGDVAGNGDGVVGAAVIPAAVLDAGDAAKLADADGQQVCAGVTSLGTIDSGGISIETDVEVTTIPNTATDAPSSTNSGAGDVGGLLTALLVLVIARAAARAPRRRDLQE